VINVESTMQRLRTPLTSALLLTIDAFDVSGHERATSEKRASAPDDLVRAETSCVLTPAHRSLFSPFRSSLRAVRPVSGVRRVTMLCSPGARVLRDSLPILDSPFPQECGTALGIGSDPSLHLRSDLLRIGRFPCSITSKARIPVLLIARSGKCASASLAVRAQSALMFVEVLKRSGVGHSALGAFLHRNRTVKNMIRHTSNYTAFGGIHV
jgi:hypothetical protein